MVWILKGATVIASFPEGKGMSQDIVIENDRILEVAQDVDVSRYPEAEVTDVSNCLIIPGLINAHLHSHDRFDKGRFDNLPLEIWISQYNPPGTSRNWTPREVYLRTILSSIELVKSGTTLVMDDVHHGSPFAPELVDAVFQAYQDIGLRAQVSAAYSDKPFYEGVPYLDKTLPSNLKSIKSPYPMPSSEWVLEYWCELAEKWTGRVQFALSPSGPQRCTDEFLQKTWEVSRKYSLPVMIHVLETKIQALTGHKLYGKGVVEHMADLGILDKRCVMAHGVWLSDRELDLIADRGACVVHNPGSNLKLGSGIAPLRSMLEREISVGLGTDNHNANDSANMFEAMKLAALIHKVGDSDYTNWVGAKDSLALATSGGASCAGLSDDLGTLEKGKKADFVVLKTETLPFTPTHDYVNQLVFSERGESVQMVVVGGEKIMDDGVISTINEKDILEEIRELAPEIMRKIDSIKAQGELLANPLNKAYQLSVNEWESVHGSFSYRLDN